MVLIFVRLIEKRIIFFPNRTQRTQSHRDERSYLFSSSENPIYIPHESRKSENVIKQLLSTKQAKALSGIRDAKKARRRRRSWREKNPLKIHETTFYFRMAERKEPLISFIILTNALDCYLSAVTQNQTSTNILNNRRRRIRLIYYMCFSRARASLTKASEKQYNVWIHNPITFPSHVLHVQSKHKLFSFNFFAATETPPFFTQPWKTSRSLLLIRSFVRFPRRVWIKFSEKHMEPFAVLPSSPEIDMNR